MSDPEFTKLNPGLSTNDTEAAATLLVAVDPLGRRPAPDRLHRPRPDATAWIDGKPDPWGMKVNPAYRGLNLPRDEWPLLDTYVPKTQNDCRRKHPAVYFNQIAAPVSTMSTIAEALLDGWPEVQTRCDFDLAPTCSSWAGSTRRPTARASCSASSPSATSPATGCAARRSRRARALRRAGRRLARRSGRDSPTQTSRSSPFTMDMKDLASPPSACLPRLDGRLHRGQDRAPRPGRRRQGRPVHPGLHDRGPATRDPATASCPTATCRSGTAG